MPPRNAGRDRPVSGPEPIITVTGQPTLERRTAASQPISGLGRWAAVIDPLALAALVTVLSWAVTR